MSGKNQRYLQQAFRARIENEMVLTRIGVLDIRNQDANVRGLLYKLTGYTAAVMEGLIAQTDTGLIVGVTAPGSAILNLGDGNLRSVLDFNGGANFSVTLDTADVTNARIDIIEATVKTRSAFTDTAVDIVDPVTKTVTPQTKDRDFELYLDVRKKTGTPAGSPVAPTPTVATSGVLTGTVAIPGTIDLSVRYIINLAVGNDSEYVEIDCRGATPAATTSAEILTALNAAGFGAVATLAPGNFIRITAPSSGENSIVAIKQPISSATDAYTTIFGVATSLGYIDQYVGANPYFKIAEITVAANQVTLNPADILDRTVKDTDWTAGAATLMNGFTLQQHRESLPMDHVPASVEDYHLAVSAIALLQGKVTKFRPVNKTFNVIQTIFDSRFYPVPGDATFRLGTGNRTRIVGGEPTPNVIFTDAIGGDMPQSGAEQIFPVRRVDQRQETTSSNYPTLTAISEATANKVPFQPDVNVYFSGAHSRVGFFVKTVGSGYTALRIDIHDSGNNELATVSIPIASLTDGGGSGVWNYANLPVALDTSQTYHYHVYVTGFTAGTTTVLGRDGSGNIAFREMYLPTAGQYNTTTDKDAVYVLSINPTTGALSYVAPTRGATDDDIVTPGDGFIGETGYDVMAADLSTLAKWNAFNYQQYIGVDIASGRIKLPSGLDVRNLLLQATIIENISNMDAKDIMRHTPMTQLTEPYLGTDTEVPDTESLEDFLARVESTFWVTGQVPNWNVAITYSGSNPTLPTVVTLSQGNLRVKLDITYVSGTDDSIDNIKYSFSRDAGVVYVVFGIKNYVYTLVDSNYYLSSVNWG